MVEKKKTIKKKPVTKSKKAKTSVKKQANKDQIRLVFGFVLLAFAVYLLFSFSSFLMNAEADQSKLQINWWKLIKDSSIRVENITGKTGAWIADIFINRWFGLSSFIFIYILGLYGSSFLNFKAKSIFSKTIKSILLIFV